MLLRGRYNETKMRFTEICLKLLRWGIYISLFVPLIIFSEFISPFHFGKAVVFRSLVEILVVVYILLLLVGGKKYLPRWTPIVIAFTIFTGIYGLATLTAVDFKFAFWGTLERMGGFFSFLHFWAWFVILTSIFKSDANNANKHANDANSCGRICVPDPDGHRERLRYSCAANDANNNANDANGNANYANNSCAADRNWIKLLRISVMVGFLSILFAYGQHFKLGDFFVGWKHESRVIGTIGNPALFAGYLLFVLFLALYLLVHNANNADRNANDANNNANDVNNNTNDTNSNTNDTNKKKWWRWFYIAVLVFGVPVLHMTAVRGSIIAFWIGLFVLGFFFIFRPNSNKKLKILVLSGLVLIIILAWTVWVLKDTSFVQNIGWLKRLTDISFKTRTLQTRLWSWESGWQGFKEKPILGWGPENFALAHAKYFNPGIFAGLGSETIWDRAHNIVLELLTTMGVLGFLSYFAIFGLVVWGLVKKIKSDFVFSAIFLTIIFVYLIHNSFIFDTTANYLLFFLVLGYINYCNYGRNYVHKFDEKEGYKISEHRKVLIIILGFILGFLAILVMYKTNIEPAFVNYTCTRAVIFQRSGRVSEALNKYQEALSYKTYQGKYETRHRLATFAIQYNENLLYNLKKGIDENMMELAINEEKKTINEHPFYYVPYLYLARFYMLKIPFYPELGEEAESAVRRALEFNSTNPRVWYELGQIKLIRKDYDGAIKAFKKALELNPEVSQSIWFLGVGYSRAGDYEKALEYMNKAIEKGYGYKNKVKDIAYLLNVYQRLGDHKKIIELCKEAIELYPDNFQFYILLARTYKEIGDYQNALFYAEKAIEIEPKLEKELEEFIKSLK
mgnify:CR=1 FL=1